MFDLEISDNFYNSIIDCGDITKSIHRILNNDFFTLEDNQKSEYLISLFYGLNNYNVSPLIIAELFKAVVSIDDYNRDNQPVANIEGAVVLECSGSGKKPIKTLNISTPSMVIAVAAGAYIIKKGSSATSSNIGSADLLYKLGFMEKQNNLYSLVETGFTFVNIEHVIPKFNNLYNGRFYDVHILSNVLGGAVTSIRGNKIVYGISMPNTKKACSALMLLAPKQDIIVYSSSEDGISFFDEILGNGTSYFTRNNGKNLISSELLSQGESIKTIATNCNDAVIIKTIVETLKRPQKNAYTNTLLLNAGFYLREAEIVKNIEDGVLLAEETLFSGKAYNKLTEIIKHSGGNPSWI